MAGAGRREGVGERASERWQADVRQAGGTGARGAQQTGRDSERGALEALRHGRGVRPQHGQTAHDTATRARPGRGLCTQAGRQLGQFGARAPSSVFDPVFDSVLFLSHCLDPVHEHYS